MVLACALIVCGVNTRTQHSGDLALILASLSQRTQQYYDRFISIICTETVQTQNLNFNLAPVGRPRIDGVRAECLERRGRQTRKRVPRGAHASIGERASRTQEPESRVYRPENRHSGAAGVSARSESEAVPVYPVGRRRRPCRGAAPSTSSRRRPSACASNGKGTASKPKAAAMMGRVWFDPETYDISQVDVRLSKPFLVPLPDGFFGIRPAIRVEKSEMTLRFSRVEFHHPDEAVMLPASIETLHRPARSAQHANPARRSPITAAFSPSLRYEPAGSDRLLAPNGSALALSSSAWPRCTKS